MDYAIKTLRDKLVAIELALNKWGDISIKEYSENYKTVVKRKKDIVKALEILEKP